MAIKNIRYWKYEGEDKNDSPILNFIEEQIDESLIENKIQEIKLNYPQEPEII